MEQTTQWQTKVQMDKQRSTKHTYKTKDRVTRTPLKTGGKLRCSTGDTRGVNLVTNNKRGKDREALTTIGTYPWSFVTQTLHNGQPSHGKTFEVTTST